MRDADLLTVLLWLLERRHQLSNAAFARTLALARHCPPSATKAWTAQELGQILDIAPSSVPPILHQLRRHGLIRTKGHPGGVHAGGWHILRIAEFEAIGAPQERPRGA